MQRERTGYGRGTSLVVTLLLGVGLAACVAGAWWRFEGGSEAVIRRAAEPHPRYRTNPDAPGRDMIRALEYGYRVTPTLGEECPESPDGG